MLQAISDSKPEDSKRCIETLLSSLKVVYNDPNSCLGPFFRKWYSDIKNDIENDRPKAKDFLASMLTFCDSIQLSEISKEKISVSKEPRTIITVLDLELNHPNRKALKNELPFVLFQFEHNSLLVHAQNQIFFVQELTILKKSTISINKTQYILSLNQFYEVNKINFSIQEITETTLFLAIYNQNSQIEKVISINGPYENLICNDFRLIITKRRNLPGLLTFSKINSDWILTAQGGVVWRYLASPYECENRLSDPISIVNGNMFKCQGKIYSISQEFVLN